MREKIEKLFRDLMASLQIAKLYTMAHPMFAKSLTKAYASLQDALSNKPQIVIGIVGHELAFEKDIFFELSKNLLSSIIYLKKRGIEKIIFESGLEKEELEKFIDFLANREEKNIEAYQQSYSLLGITKIKIGKITDVSKQEEGHKTQSSLPRKMYDNSLEKVSNTLNDVFDLQKIDHISLKFSLQNILENLTTGYQEFLRLLTIKRYDLETYVHLLNVAILSMFFSSKIGFDKKDVFEIGISALFHDVGKLFISRKILTKKERLDDKEFEQIKSHTVLGAEIMLRYTETLGVLPAVVCFEHHLKFDLSGYPKVPLPTKPHIASLIVNICDVYDALFQRRGYKTDYSPDLIYNIMNREKGATFRPDLLDQFFKFMGVWPVGSIVKLSDSRIAVVREVNEDEIFRPKVEVIHPRTDKEFIDLNISKGIKIDSFLDPWKEGKEFLKLV